MVKLASSVYTGRMSATGCETAQDAKWQAPLLIALVLLSLLWTWIPGQVGAAPAIIVGRVIAITDGDSLKLLTPDRRQIKVRLAQIDAPESGQPWGDKSKRALSDLVYGKNIRIETSGTDRYGRTIGKVYLGSAYVNAEMVKTGAAWTFIEYLTDKRFIEYEKQARLERRGLWIMPPGQIVAPWTWRANRRAASKLSFTDLPSIEFHQNGPSTAGNCSTKHYCKQMTSCAEARHYLSQCRVLSLDGDGDGVPCEALCRPL